MNIKILGYGEIGKAVTKYVEQFPGMDIFIQDPLYKLYPPERKTFDFVLVCIPYSDNFMQIVLNELKTTNKIIVFSTVPIGTVEQIPKAVHVPIEGKHPNLLDSLLYWPIFIGYNDDLYLKDYLDFFSNIQKECIPVKNTRTTEICKLLSTLLYGVNIEFYRYAATLFDLHNSDSSVFQEYNAAYNALYHSLGYPGIKRYILTYPEGTIGGHCVCQNAEYLEGVFADIVKKQ